MITFREMTWMRLIVGVLLFFAIGFMSGVIFAICFLFYR